MKPSKKIVLFTALAALFSFQAKAQCKRFTKKNCLPALTPFVYNGQLTSALMSPGETAEIVMTFTPGHNYRLLFCGQEVIGNLLFKIMDKNHKVIYERKKADEKPYFDFNVTSTQQFIIEVYIPEKETPNGLVPSGCVSLMVGYKS
jgi:hypothetical protein